MIKYFLIGFGIIAFSGLHALNIKGFKPDKTVVYKKVDGHELKMNIFLPENHKASDNRPAIVFFFDGGWNGGSPSQFYPFCAHLAKKGVVAMSAEYRIKSKHKTDPRACIKDGKSAIRWARANAKAYGIDPNRLAAGGGSAGGHVAAATGTDTKFIEEGEDSSVSSWPNALVLCNPVLDNGPNGYGHSRVKDYWQGFSPMHNVNKQTPPSIFFLGSKDPLIPVSTGKKWEKIVADQGKVSELHVWEGQPHGFFNYGRSKRENGGVVFNEICQKMDAFLIKIKFLEK